MESRTAPQPDGPNFVPTLRRVRNVVRGWKKDGNVYEVRAPSGAVTTVEIGADPGGVPAGPGPMELMLVSLITCAGSTFDEILAKMRHPALALNVVADGERAERAPRVYTAISLEFHVATDAPDDRIARAIRLTEQTCSAWNMLSKATRIGSRVIVVRDVDPAVTRPLRQRVLRPHQTLEELVTPGESASGSMWLAALDDGEVVGTVGLLPEPNPDGGPEPAIRLRAMATSEGTRGRGLGRVLLDAALDRAWRAGAAQVWCGARTPAAGFYARAGFEETSDVYEVDVIGPHVHMAIQRP